jgi:hypothetical protein
MKSDTASAPHDIRLQLVDHAVGKDRGMPGTRLDGAAHRRPRLLPGGGRIEKALALNPLDIDEKLKPLNVGQFQKPGRGHEIDPQHIDTQLADQGKITGGLIGRRKGFSPAVRGKWTVSQTPEKEFTPAQTQELSVGAHSIAGRFRIRHGSLDDNGLGFNHKALVLTSRTVRSAVRPLRSPPAPTGRSRFSDRHFAPTTA